MTKIIAKYDECIEDEITGISISDLDEILAKYGNVLKVVGLTVSKMEGQYV